MYIQINNDFDEELTNAEYYDVNAEERLSAFGPVSTINLFVGANNSGKSRFLRQLIKKAGIYSTTSKFNLREKILDISPEINGASIGTGVSIRIKKIDVEGIHPNMQFIKGKRLIKVEDYFINRNEKEVSLDAEFFQKMTSAITEAAAGNYDKLKAIIEDKESIEKLEIVYEITKNNIKSSTLRFLIIPNYSEKYRSDVESCYKAVNTFLATGILKNTYQTVYIPILRSATSLFETYNSSKKYSTDIFKYTALTNYQLNDKEAHGKGIKNEVFTGLGLYKKLKRERNSKKDIRKKIVEFEKFISENFFQKKHIEVTPIESDIANEEQITIYLDGKELPLHSLGDGIQSLIILLYPMFMAEPETWVFIEEPEINLHPGMQRIFLEQLTKEPLKSKKLKYFITTHSNHLLDLSLEMGEETSIFTFDKKILEGDKAHFEIKNVKSGDTDVLNLLGVKNSSVFMANCTIWVEGITDRYYIREFLKAYYKQFEESTVYKEDLHYAFFEYAGTNIEHYIFEEPALIKETPAIKAQFLSNKILLVADMDKGKEKRHLKRELAQYKNFQFELLSVREIENLLSEQNLSELLPNVHTGFKRKIDFTKIKFSEYKGEYLAEYLKTTFGSNVVGKAFIAESGTINTKYKLDLALAAKDNLTWENMSEPAKELAKKIYKFIKKANS